MKTVPTILLTLALAVPLTWFASRSVTRDVIRPDPHPPAKAAVFYQSAMHPWIKSDKPGRCTICGMELTPVYEGQKGVEMDNDILSLSSNMVQVLRVQTATARKQAMARTLDVAGIVDDDASKHRILSAPVEGRIEKLYITHHGAEAKQGEPLIDIYSPTLLQVEREYRQLTGNLKTNTGVKLRQMGFSAAQIEALDRKPVDSLVSQILAPESGSVVDTAVFSGQYVKEGDRLIEIADFSIMWFMFRAYEQDMPWIKLGQKVEVTTPSVPGKTFTGTIAVIDPNFDEVTRSTRVRVELPNPMIEGRRELLHRVYAEGKVDLSIPETLSIPRSAVIQTGAEAVVFVEKGGGAYGRQVVKLGRRGDRLVEVIEGLKEGDVVVTEGNLLMDGQAEMNRSYSEAPITSPIGNNAPPAITQKENDAVGNFVAAADKTAAALAADDLQKFESSAAPLMEATEELIGLLKERSDLAPLLDPLEKIGQLQGSGNLAGARKAFLTFTQAAVGLLQPLRKSPGIPPYEIWECPMVDRAIPGAPKKGRWIQASGRGIQNPFFGADMLECGSRVKP